MRAPLKYHQRGEHLALFGSPEPRDRYIGEFSPAGDRAALQAAVMAMHRQNAEGHSDD